MWTNCFLSCHSPKCFTPHISNKSWFFLFHFVLSTKCVINFRKMIYDMIYDMMWNEIIWYDVIQCDVMWGHVIRYKIIWYYIRWAWDYMIWYGVMWCDVMWECDIIGHSLSEFSILPIWQASKHITAIYSIKRKPMMIWGGSYKEILGDLLLLLLLWIDNALHLNAVASF